jgi:hypothetical protein
VNAPLLDPCKCCTDAAEPSVWSSIATADTPAAQMRSVCHGQVPTRKSLHPNQSSFKPPVNPTWRPVTGSRYRVPLQRPVKGSQLDWSALPSVLQHAFILPPNTHQQRLHSGPLSASTKSSGCGRVTAREWSSAALDWKGGADTWCSVRCAHGSGSVACWALQRLPRMCLASPSCI